MRTALVNPSNIIENVIELANGAVYAIAAGYQLIADPNNQAAIGGSWNAAATPTFSAAPAASTSNRDILTQRAINALSTNDTFLALASPTNAQVLNQVQTLTKECNGLIRLLLNQLDTITDTT